MSTVVELKEQLVSLGANPEELEGLKYTQLVSMLKKLSPETLNKDAIKPVEKQEKPKKRVIARDELIPIMNNTTGHCWYQSKQSGQEWTFNTYGETDEMEFGELIKMKNAHPRYLNEPWLIILDEDVVEHLGLSKLYENVMTPEQVDEFFKLSPDKMKEILSKTPIGMKQLIVSRAMKGIQNKTFDSVQRIRAIQEACKVELLPLLEE